MMKVRNIRWHTVLIGTLKTETSNFALYPSLHWKPVECSEQCCCTCMPGRNINNNAAAVADDNNYINKSSSSARAHTHTHTHTSSSFLYARMSGSYIFNPSFSKEFKIWLCSRTSQLIALVNSWRSGLGIGFERGIVVGQLLNVPLSNLLVYLRDGSAEICWCCNSETEGADRAYPPPPPPPVKKRTEKNPKRTGSSALCGRRFMEGIFLQE